MVLRKPEIKYTRYFLVPRCFCGCGKRLDDLVSSLPDHLLWLYGIKKKTLITHPILLLNILCFPSFPLCTTSDGREGWLGCFLRCELKDRRWFSFNTSCFTSFLWFHFCTLSMLCCQFSCSLGWFHLYSLEIYMWAIWALAPAAALNSSTAISISVGLPISAIIVPK